MVPSPRARLDIAVDCFHTLSEISEQLRPRENFSGEGDSLSRKEQLFCVSHCKLS